jgi:hypothetical protein
VEAGSRDESDYFAGMFVLGVALAAPLGASAAPISGIGATNTSHSLVEHVYYSCRNVTTCYVNEYGHRHCHWHRVCRHWY